MSIVGRIVGAVVLGGGTYGAAILLEVAWAPEVVYGATGGAALLGALFGAKAWEIVAQIF